MKILIAFDQTRGLSHCKRSPTTGGTRHSSHVQSVLGDTVATLGDRQHTDTVLDVATCMI